MTDRINIHAEVFALCEHFGLNPHDVYKITINPADAIVDFWIRGEDGKLRIGEDGKTPRGQRAFKVTT